MTNKDTNSQDSIQVGNESIQTMQSVEKEEVMENCQQCGSYICKCEVKEFIPQSNTLGTTMEWTKETKAISEAWWNYWNYMGKPDRDFIEKWWLEKLSQSKAETIKECIEKIKEIKKYPNIENMNTRTWKAGYHTALDILKDLLSKDIEQ